MELFKICRSVLLAEKEKYMEIVTSWEKEGANKALEKVALNSLREGLSVETVVKITGLTQERVQQLKAELKAENNK